MANPPQFAILNHAAIDSEIPKESAAQRLGISLEPIVRISRTRRLVFRNLDSGRLRREAASEAVPILRLSTIFFLMGSATVFAFHGLILRFCRGRGLEPAAGACHRLCGRC